MDEKGTNMTDAGKHSNLSYSRRKCVHVCVRPSLYIGPVVRIKRALNKLKQECSDMDVQIGIVRDKYKRVHFRLSLY